MHLEVSRSAERPTAHRTHEWLIVAMQALVAHQISAGGKPAAADGTREVALCVVNMHVALEVCGRRQLLATDAAVKLAVVIVDAPMLLQVALVGECFATLRTHVWLLLCVCHLRQQQHNTILTFTTCTWSAGGLNLRRGQSLGGR